MEYGRLNLNIPSSDPYLPEVVAAFLGEIGYDSFEEFDGGLNAYIQASSFNENSVKEVLAAIPGCIECTFTFSLLPDINWNAEWEKNFSPVMIDDRCIIRASFHPHRPDFKHTILIDPKMAFGTGHHDTTWMMISTMFELSFTGKTVLDMGTGTGILAILASQLGAKEIIAADIDEWACRNAEENIKLNKADRITILKGDLDFLPRMKFDLILANINRNILVDHLPGYASRSNSGCKLLMSGFLADDKSILCEAAEKNGFSMLKHIERNQWNAALFIKV